MDNFSLPEDIEKAGTDTLAATSALQQKAREVRQSNKVNWQTYAQSKMISQEDFHFISRFDAAPDAAAREAIVAEKPLQCAKTFYNLLGHISKDQTIQYLLTMVDDFLQENKARVALFRQYSKAKNESVWAHFLNLLTRPDAFIQNMTARVVAKMACWSLELMSGSDLQYFLTWLKDQLRLQNNEYIQSVARCLQMLLRIDAYRLAFVSVDGVATLVSVLSGRVNFQVQYQLAFCLWVTSFNSSLATRLNKFGVIPILADILSDAQKEKVSRIILAVFRNLIEKPGDAVVIKENCISMVQCKVKKQLELLEQRKFDDEDIQEDIAFLLEKLDASVQDLSSYDEYVTEVKSGRLEWSPVHRSEKFWRENANKFNDKNYELLKILIQLLEGCKDPLVLCVACFDLGEYVRHYQRGKHVLEQLGGKTMVMALLGHEDPNVRYEALLAVQKLMVHNWEYLGKQLEKPQYVSGRQVGLAAA